MAYRHLKNRFPMELTSIIINYTYNNEPKRPQRPDLKALSLFNRVNPTRISYTMMNKVALRQQIDNIELVMSDPMKVYNIVHIRLLYELPPNPNSLFNWTFSPIKNLNIFQMAYRHLKDRLPRELTSIVISYITAPHDFSVIYIIIRAIDLIIEHTYFFQICYGNIGYVFDEIDVSRKIKILQGTIGNMNLKKRKIKSKTPSFPLCPKCHRAKSGVLLYESNMLGKIFAACIVYIYILSTIYKIGSS